MVAAINAGLEQAVFTLKASGLVNSPDLDAVWHFQFIGPPAIAAARDIGWDGLSITAALRPTPRACEFVRTFGGGFHAGEAFAQGWLERRTGAWLQYSCRPIFHCRRWLQARLVAAYVEPRGYADHGKFFL
jgi:hypothetical protein